MAHIDYFFATVSPFVYLAGTKLEEVAARYGASVTYKPVDPSAIFTRTGGLPLGQRHESRRAYRLQELRRQSAKTGLALNPQPMFWPVNPAPSAYAVLAAQAAGGGDLGGLVHGLARACWGEDRDISDDAVIKEQMTAHGFDPAIADKGMLAAAETYAATLEEAVSRGVFGVPFYIVGSECFWGQDRLEDLELHLAGKI